MNSHQRRVTKRYWRQSVTLKKGLTFEQYKEVRKWCKDKFGKVGYRWSNTWCYTVFEFRNKSDCAVFMLKWM